MNIHHRKNRPKIKTLVSARSNSMLSLVKQKFLLLGILAATGTLEAAYAAVLMPPEIQFKDRHGVDLLGGHVSVIQQDISIGGGMGLSHSVGTQTSNFANYNDETKARFAPEGYLEPYRGLIDEEIYSECQGCPIKYRMNVSDGTSSTSFDTTADHQSFTPRGDSRYQLFFVNNPTETDQYHQSIIDFSEATGGFTGFVLIKPDGTVVYYPAPSVTSVRAFMSHIQKPNGYVIAVTMAPVLSMRAVTDVSTNTGFQLKYVYQYSTKTSAPVAELPAAQAKEWSQYMPKYIVGINNAVARCPSGHNVYRKYPTPVVNNEGQSKNAVLAGACPQWASTANWPVVTYTWPDYMPLSMYQTTASFKVTDPMGVVTEYVHTPWTTKTSDGFKYPQAWYDTTPRLTQIKRAGKVLMNYAYETPDTLIYFGYGVGFNFIDPGRPARVQSSWVDDDKITYVTNIPMGHSGVQTGVINNGTGYQAVNSASYEEQGPMKMSAWDKSVHFASAKVGRLTSVEYKLGGKKISLQYDTHDVGTAKSHNITKKTEDGLDTTAGGYVVCTPLNYKICNQPTWITDPNGKTTNYEYYPESGLPKKITLPADSNGIRPQTRYFYTPISAVYLLTHDSTVPEVSPLPIYLLTRESKCQNTAASGNSCTDSNDEIVTEYDYGLSQDGIANNLLLRGVTITANNSQGIRESRRTCYAYDKYGNKIGETKPKADLESCS